MRAAYAWICGIFLAVPALLKLIADPSVSRARQADWWRGLRATGHWEQRGCERRSTAVEPVSRWRG